MTTPESIVVGLEQAKALKEAGWPQDTVHVWYPPTRQFPNWELDRGGPWESDGEQPLSAPTAEEILRTFPMLLYKHGSPPRMLEVSRGADDDTFTVMYKSDDEPIADWLVAEGISLADSAAAMWIYLKTHSHLPNESTAHH